MQIIRLSEYIENDTFLIDNIFEIYNMLKFIRKDYEHFFKWYWSIAIAKLFNNQMEFFVAINEIEIAGILIAKKEDNESKICTLYVKDNYQCQGIGSALLKESFDYLQTTKPIITFTDYKLPMFEKFIKKYDWSIDEKCYKEYTKKYEYKCNTNRH